MVINEYCIFAIQLTKIQTWKDKPLPYREQDDELLLNTNFICIFSYNLVPYITIKYKIVVYIGTGLKINFNLDFNGQRDYIKLFLFYTIIPVLIRLYR